MCATIRSFRDIRYSLYGYHVVGTWMHHGSRIVGAGEGRMDEYHSKGWFTSVLFGRGLEYLDHVGQETRNIGISVCNYYSSLITYR